jgi:hypothetical protein
MKDDLIVILCFELLVIALIGAFYTVTFPMLVVILSIGTLYTAYTYDKEIKNGRND